MLLHYLKISIRYFSKNKLISSINVLGLSVAMAFCVLIFFFIRQELSYDYFFKKADRLYVMTYQNLVPGLENKMVYLPLPLAAVLKQEIPEVKNVVPFSDGKVVVHRGNKIFSEPAIFTSGEFFNAFSFPLLSGNPGTSLLQTNNVVLTAKLAKKYFGNEDPVGKTVLINTVDREEPFIVSAVCDAVPENTSIQFALLLRIEKRPFYARSSINWHSYNTPIFVELADGANSQSLHHNLASLTSKYFDESIKRLKDKNKLAANTKVIELNFFPLKQLHLTPELHWSNGSSPKYTYILSGIAILILVIACINYVSLSLSLASGRSMEVGVRKVAGAARLQLVFQFWMESILLGILSTISSLVLIKLFLPVFNQLTGKSFSIGMPELLLASVFLLGLLLLISLVTGGYPALIMSSFKPASVLKSGNTYRFRPSLIKGLVVIQFALSAFLIISALVMLRQMRFISHKDLGYDKNELIVVPTFSGDNNKGTQIVELLKNRLMEEKTIVSVSGTSAPPNNMMWSIDGYTFQGKDKEAFTYHVDWDFLQTMGISLLHGKDFSKNFSSDTADGILVNEALINDLELKNPVGQSIPWVGDNSKNMKILGVVKNFNFLSLENKIQPMLLYMNNYNKIQYALIRIKPGTTQASLHIIGAAWKQINPNQPFEYSFQADQVAGQYEQYQRWIEIMTIATVMAILIACMGLFGLAGIITVNKTKEIGIRKVFGADVKSILLLLNKDILLLCIVSFVLALPAVWWVMNHWLQNFAYRIPIKWDIPLLSMIFALGITLLTVSYHSLKAAFANPVKNLRNE